MVVKPIASRATRADNGYAEGRSSTPANWRPTTPSNNRKMRWRNNNRTAGLFLGPAALAHPRFVYGGDVILHDLESRASVADKS